MDNKTLFESKLQKQQKEMKKQRKKREEPKEIPMKIPKEVFCTKKEREILSPNCVFKANIIQYYKGNNLEAHVDLVRQYNINTVFK